MDNNFNNQTGDESNQVDQAKYSNLIHSKEDLEKLSNEQLIELYKINNYSLDAIDRVYNFSKDTSRRYYKKRNIDYIRISKEHKDLVLQKYYKNPNRCQHCGKILDWEYKGGIYCCRSCAISEGNRKVTKNPIGKNGAVSKYGGEKKRLDYYNTQKHNDLISLKYPELELPLIDPGCCFICGKYHCENEFCKTHTFPQLIGFVIHLGFDQKTIGTEKVFFEFKRIRDLIYHLYWDDGLSSLDLGKMFNYSCGIMTTDVFNNLDIPKRTSSEATINTIKRNKSIGILNSNSGIAGLSKNIIQGWHYTWFGEKVFLRSSYETDYANILDKKQVIYQVEKLRIEYFNTILGSIRIAIPDFYLPDTKEIIEVKSDFTLDIQEILDKFNSYEKLGYIPKLILEHKEVNLYDIENQVSLSRLNKIKNRNINFYKT